MMVNSYRQLNLSQYAIFTLFNVLIGPATRDGPVIEQTVI